MKKVNFDWRLPISSLGYSSTLNFGLTAAFVLLAFCGFSQIFTIGTGTGSNTNTSYPAPYGNWYWGSRAQYIYRASELTAAGAAAGQVNSIAFNVTNTNGAPAHQGFSVYMKNSATNDLSAAWETGMTQVFGPVNHTPVSGWNTHTLSTPFIWDGTSNLIVEVCFNNTGFTDNASTQWTTGLPTGTSRTFRQDASGVCGNNGNSNQNPTNRPNAQFNIVSAACSGAPTAGTVVAPSGAFCPGDIANVSLNGATAASGLTYQWQESPDNAVWTNIAGATNASASVTVNADVYVRCIITCTNSSLSDTTGSQGLFLGGCAQSVQTCSQTDGGTVVVSATGFQGIAVGAGTVEFTYNGDLGSGFEYLEVFDNTGALFATLNGQGFTDCAASFDAFPLTMNQINSMLAAGGGNIDFTVTAQSSVNAFCSPGSGTGGNNSFCIAARIQAPNLVVANDAGMAAVYNPAPFQCVTDTFLNVAIQNGGSDTLLSATINWSVNGTAQTPVLWNGSIDPFSMGDSTFVASYPFTPGDVIQLVTSNPNGVTDSLPQNDTLNYVVPGVSMNGTYTIDSNGIGPNNFPSIDSATATLMARGVCGPVIFDIADNVYNEQLLLGMVPGASATNNIVFQSANGDSSLVTIRYASTSVTYDGTVNLTGGASYIHFRDLTIYNNATSSTYANAVTLGGNSEDVTFVNCHIKNDITTTTSTFASLVYKNGVVNDNISFDHCGFTNGSNAIYWFGVFAEYDDNFSVTNCDFINQYYRGIYAYYQNNMVADSNYITSTASYNFGYGYQLFNLSGDGLSFQGNHIEQTNVFPEYGIYLVNVTADLNGYADVIGNVISMPFAGSDGIYLSNGLFTDISNNSILMSDLSSFSEAIYITNGAVNFLHNNAVKAVGAARAIEVFGNGIYSSDNNAFSADQTLAVWSGTHTDLPSLQAATGQDSNSVELMGPMFADTATLRVCNDSLDGAGMANAKHTYDLQGDPSDQMAMDIGADQFATSSSFSLRDTIGLCPGGTATVEAWYFDTIVWNNSDTGNIYTTNLSGVITVEAFGLCGTAMDTVVVAPAPQVSLPANTIICFDSTGMVDANISAVSYQWSNGDTTEMITITMPGTYAVTVTDADGCVSDAQTVADVSVPVDLTDTTAMCGGEPVDVDAGISGGTYDWSNGDQTQVSTITTPGVVDVTVTDADGCVSTDATEVIDVPIPAADFTSSALNWGVEFSNLSTANANYLWDFGDGSTSTDFEPSHLYPWSTDSTLYTVTLVTSNVCGSDTFTADVYVGPEVGINELGAGGYYSVYPNPSNGQINISFVDVNQEDFEFTVFDISGSIITTKKVGAIASSHIETVDLQNLSPGIYLLQVNIGESSNVTRLIIQ